MSDKKPIIGFIGLGHMGRGMAKNILQAGYPLRVKGNTNRAPVENLVATGALEVMTAREMAESCDIIHLCLSNTPQVEAIVHGPDGILAGARDGLIIIDATTADPTSTLRLAAELAEEGAVLVDAPLGRTPKHAEDGALHAMIGCDERTLEVIRPVLETWAEVIQHIGPVGSAHKMKLLLNFISMGSAALLSEMIVLGAKMGVPPATVREVIGASRQNNGFFQTFMQYVVDRDRDAHKFSIANGSKDLRYVAAMAAEAGMTSIMVSAARQYFVMAEATGRGGDYVPMLSDLVGQVNGIDMGSTGKT